MTMAEAAYVYTKEHSRNITQSRGFITSIPSNPAMLQNKQSHKWINNGTATSLIETVKKERTVITFLQKYEQRVILFLLFHWC